MPTVEEVQRWGGRRLVGPHEDKLGRIDHVYLDRQTGEPTFAAVKTGLFGTRSTLVPIGGARTDAVSVHVPFGKDQVRDAPDIAAGDELSAQQEQELYAHYTA